MDAIEYEEDSLEDHLIFPMDPFTSSSQNSGGVRDLIKTLIKCDEFTCSFDELRKYGNFTVSSVNALVNQYSEIFELKNLSKVKLQHFLKICTENCTERGCRHIMSCRHIHICHDYIHGKCINSDCPRGHRWDTSHNQLILSQMYVDDINIGVLHELVNSVGITHSQLPNLEICSDYNISICSTPNCPSLHVCYAYFNALIDDNMINDLGLCMLNHNLLSISCCTLLLKSNFNTNTDQRDVALALLSANPHIRRGSGCKSFDHRFPVCEQKKNESFAQAIWADDYKGPCNVKVCEICYYSVEGQCLNENKGCPRLHAKHHFHWQVSQDGVSWFNLCKSHIHCLEVAFCNPKNDGTTLPILDYSELETSYEDHIMMGKDSWYSDFNQMILSNNLGSRVLKIRRLSTDPTFGINISKFVWYFKDSNDKWIKFNSNDVTGDVHSGLTSDEIEYAFLQNPTSSLESTYMRCNYVLLFTEMIQLDVDRNITYEVKRRPMKHFEDPNMDLPEYWKVMPSNETMQRVTLECDSKEYASIVKLMDFQPLETSIERIQNPALWRAFQSKVEILTALNGSEGLNLQQLFHGTTSEAVDSICMNNFDYRLHGTRHGCIYGKGTYFSTSPSLSSRYAIPNSDGFLFMFLAKVVVGSVTKGNYSTQKPPINESTGLYHNSTVNCEHRKTIIVKYDHQEMYPEYLIKFKLGPRCRTVFRRMQSMRLLMARTSHGHPPKNPLKQQKNHLND